MNIAKQCYGLAWCEITRGHRIHLGNDRAAISVAANYFNGLTRLNRFRNQGLRCQPNALDLQLPSIWADCLNFTLQMNLWGLG
ncbi:MAG: hypothetical protein B7Z83_11350 [Thiomonas sp. 20-64-5]|nr:MAG: hypothetical protein B7Z83_11350 [Thiomonas sp. 20-64-5]